MISVISILDNIKYCSSVIDLLTFISIFSILRWISIGSQSLILNLCQKMDKKFFHYPFYSGNETFLIIILCSIYLNFNSSPNYPTIFVLVFPIQMMNLLSKLFFTVFIRLTSYFIKIVDEVNKVRIIYFLIWRLENYG